MLLVYLEVVINNNGEASHRQNALLAVQEDLRNTVAVSEYAKNYTIRAPFIRNKIKEIIYDMASSSVLSSLKRHCSIFQLIKRLIKALIALVSKFMDYYFTYRFFKFFVMRYVWPRLSKNVKELFTTLSSQFMNMIKGFFIGLPLRGIRAFMNSSYSVILKPFRWLIPNSIENFLDSTYKKLVLKIPDPVKAAQALFKTAKRIKSEVGTPIMNSIKAVGIKDAFKTVTGTVKGVLSLPKVFLTEGFSGVTNLFGKATDKVLSAPGKILDKAIDAPKEILKNVGDLGKNVVGLATDAGKKTISIATGAVTGTVKGVVGGIKKIGSIFGGLFS